MNARMLRPLELVVAAALLVAACGAEAPSESPVPSVAEPTAPTDTELVPAAMGSGATLASTTPATVPAAPPPTTEERAAPDRDLTAEEAAALLAEYGVEECFLTSMGPCDLDWHKHGLDGCVISSLGPCDKDGVWFCHDRQTGWAPCDPIELEPGTEIECPAGMTPVPLSFPGRADEGCWVECDDYEQCEPPPEPPSDVRETARRILAAALSAEPDALTLVHASPAQWGSSALGCPIEGHGYTAAVEDGWRFRYEHGGRTYFVHLSTEWGRLHGIAVVREDGWRRLGGEPCIEYRSGSDAPGE